MRFRLTTFVVAILLVNVLGTKPCAHPGCKGVPTDEDEGAHGAEHTRNANANSEFATTSPSESGSPRQDKMYFSHGAPDSDSEGHSKSSSSAFNSDSEGSERWVIESFFDSELFPPVKKTKRRRVTQGSNSPHSDREGLADHSDSASDHSAYASDHSAHTSAYASDHSAHTSAHASDSAHTSDSDSAHNSADASDSAHASGRSASKTPQSDSKGLTGPAAFVKRNRRAATQRHYTSEHWQLGGEEPVDPSRKTLIVGSTGPTGSVKKGRRSRTKGPHGAPNSLHSDGKVGSGLFGNTAHASGQGSIATSRGPAASVIGRRRRVTKRPHSDGEGSVLFDNPTHDSPSGSAAGHATTPVKRRRKAVWPPSNIDENMTKNGKFSKKCCGRNYTCPATWHLHYDHEHSSETFPCRYECLNKKGEPYFAKSRNQKKHHEYKCTKNPEPPYPCPSCIYRAATAQHLTNHRERKHGYKPNV